MPGTPLLFGRKEVAFDLRFVLTIFLDDELATLFENCVHQILRTYFWNKMLHGHNRSIKYLRHCFKETYKGKNE
jgi:hypothetical protein